MPTFCRGRPSLLCRAVGPPLCRWGGWVATSSIGYQLGPTRRSSQPGPPGCCLLGMAALQWRFSAEPAAPAGWSGALGCGTNDDLGPLGSDFYEWWATCGERASDQPSAVRAAAASELAAAAASGDVGILGRILGSGLAGDGVADALAAALTFEQDEVVRALLEAGAAVDAVVLAHAGIHSDIAFRRPIHLD
jgi:hypothetical protein